MKSGAYDVLSEHQQIRRLVDGIERSLEQRETDNGTWQETAAPLVEELSRGLVSHFAGEELELFLDVKERLPRHIPTVETLTEQHQQLGQAFEKLRELFAARATRGESGEEERLVSYLRDVLSRLRTHEEQENELMLLAYWQDLGETD
jgi:hemerythrin-like domain-containing protein